MRSWAVPAAIIVAVEYVFALLIGIRVGFRYRIPFETYMILGIAFAFVGAVGIVLVKLAIYGSQRERAPMRRMLADVPYLSSFIAAVLLSALQISVLTWTKVMLPIAAPFWADSLLADLDHLLFRTDPWLVANELFGSAAPLFDRAYITWAPVKFGTFLFLAFAPQSDRKSRALVAYFLMMAAVAIGQYVLSSAGPIFYGKLGLGSRFSQMPVEPWVATARDYLWRDHLSAGGEIGGGISAMPSLHVAAALWISLTWRSYDRRLGWLGFIYFLTIAIGSVLLGWHYAADGIAAVVITACAWAVSSRLILRGERQERAVLAARPISRAYGGVE